MQDTYFTIVNPAAGGGRCRRRVDGALRGLERAGMKLEMQKTSAPGDATKLARDAYSAGYRAFLAVGGDGTAFEVVNGLFPATTRNESIRLGMLPLGTGNSFVRDFGITDERSALDALVRRETRPVDVIRVTHRDGQLHYLNLLSIGFSARAGSLMNRRFKSLGAVGYVLSVLISVARLEHLERGIRLDDDETVDERKAVLVSFSNSRFTGGTMMMAPDADPSDGLLDVVRVGGLGRTEFVAAFPRIFRGTHVELDAIEQARAAKVRFADERPLDVMIDGEILTLTLRDLTVLPRALEVIA